MIGEGPAGLSCAYFRSKVGHNVQIFEGNPRLGGMLRYGIVYYRLTKYILEEDIQNILNLGNINVECNCDIASKENIENIFENFDATFVSIGYWISNRLLIPGEEEAGVVSAIEFLHNLANRELICCIDKDIITVGGGKAAMDSACTELCLGANSVNVVYRRRLEDMTAVNGEVITAREEGIEILTLLAPKGFKTSDFRRKVFLLQPKMLGQYDMCG
ncbi:MAG: NAD(P)-binding protein [Eggerthellaceae bacterium]|nr:NAD(P)-binding protein [Eggerthellaceae bacterium]